MLGRLAHLASRVVLRHPVGVLAGLLLLVAGIEALQSFPEVTPGGHAIGEIIRNLAYAVIGALIFQWLVVELPARELRRKSYDFNTPPFQVLLTAGPGLLEPYRQMAKMAGRQLDVWDREAVEKFATTVMSVALSTQPNRVKMIRTVIETGIPRALSQLSSSVAYMDSEVAHALSMFPRPDGLTTALQVRQTPSGGVEPGVDAHIVWELLEAARRLYPALLDSRAYDATIFQPSLSSPILGDTPISVDSIFRSKET